MINQMLTFCTLKECIDGALVGAHQARQSKYNKVMFVVNSLILSKYFAMQTANILVSGNQ